MKKALLLTILLLNLCFSYAQDTLKLFDPARSRVIPIAIYKPATSKIHNRPVVVFNHGYGANQGNDYLYYSYLTEKLAAAGFYVVSIQHELPTDSLMPLEGIPQVVRRPFWDRGADNILYVIKHLKLKHVTLIGHSNGGDMVALFPQKYPGIAEKIITLDNRRMSLPRTLSPSVYTLRSSDQPADDGVLPTKEEEKKYRMTVIKLPATIHNDMDDDASPAQRKEITDYLLQFLHEK